MGLIQDLARKLGETLKQSPEHKALQAAKRKVQADGKAEKLIREFRTRQMELSARQMQGQKINEAEIKQLQKMAQDLQGNPVVKEYFEAEVRLGQLWADVQRILAQSLGMEVPGKK